MARIILPMYRGPMDIVGAQYIGRRRIAASPITPILIRKVRNKFLLHLAVVENGIDMECYGSTEAKNAATKCISN